MCLLSDKGVQSEYKNKRNGIQTTKTEPLQEENSTTRLNKLIKMIENLSTKYELKSLKVKLQVKVSMKERAKH